MNNKIAKAIEVFKKGGIVIFPTDTAFGIGCRIDSKKAIDKLVNLRKRSKNKPLLVLVSSTEMAEKYLLPIPEKVKALIRSYWPGKLTIIFKCKKDKVMFPIRDERGTLGVRCPDNEILKKLIDGVDVPIVAPSANFSGEKTPFKFEDLDPELVKQADYILNGRINQPTGGENKVSTIIDCAVTPWKIIRDGAVKIYGFNF